MSGYPDKEHINAYVGSVGEYLDSIGASPDNDIIKGKCFHEWESIGLLGKTGDIYRCKKCGKEIDMTEDDDF